MDAEVTRPGAARRGELAALLGATACALALAVPLLGARARPGYSHVSQFISELGERGAPGAHWVAAAGFAPIGLSVLGFLACAAVAFPASRRTTFGVVCLGAVGAAYLVSAVAPCDPGCPSAGSFSQSVHNLFGLLEYLGAIAGFLLLRPVLRASARWRPLAPAAALAAACVAIGFLGLFVPPLAPYRGASQRVAELAIFLWIALASALLLRGRA